MTHPPLPPATGYRPFEAGPFRIALGLTAIPDRDWLDIDEFYPAHLAERRLLIAGRRADVLTAIDGSAAMKAELLEVLIMHLCTRHPRSGSPGMAEA